MRQRVGLLWVLGIMLALDGCGAGSGPATSGLRALSATSVGQRPLPANGPGSPIDSGWVVAPDSHLDGAPFPDEGNGRVAVITVDDHPLAVVQAYLTQAAAHGVHAQVQCEAHLPRGASTYTPELLDDSKPITGRAQAIVCRANGGTDVDATSWQLFLHWGTYYDRRGPTFASIVMRFRESAQQAPPAPVAAAPRRMPPMIRWAPPSLPTTGQRLDGDYAGITLRVAAGSALVAPVADDGCTTGGFAAVLRATGGGAVAGEYLDQFASNGFPPGPPSHPDARSTLVRGSSAGGGDVSLTQLADGSDHWLLIQRCND